MERDPNLVMENGLTADAHDFAAVVASRRDALATLRSAVSLAVPCPVLITGEPGAGKTWLVRSFVAGAPAGWRAVSVDLAAAMDALEFLRLVGHAVGVSASSRLGKARLRLQGALADEASEGRRWALVVDEGHRGRSGVWDEVQTLANQLGRPGGFAALFVVGETELARSLSARRSSIGLAAQISTHVHLKPLDLDEARDLLDFAGGPGIADERVLEELHRQSHGNPALLLRLARAFGQQRGIGSRGGSDRAQRRTGRGHERHSTPPLQAPGDLDAEAHPDSSREIVKEEKGSTRPAGRGSVRPAAPALIPTKPPIRDEEGLVEVGWEGDLLDELATDETPSTESAAFLSDDSSLNEELIEDRYAALQALSERTREEFWPATNASSALPREKPDEARGSDESPDERPGPRDTADGASPAGIRAEGQHEFAPYSQLFTRFRQSKQPGP